MEFQRKVDSEHADVDAVLNMAPTDQETEVVPPAEEPGEMPLPSDSKAIFLGGLFVLALLATAYVGSEIGTRVLPIGKPEQRKKSWAVEFCCGCSGCQFRSSFFWPSSIIN